MIPNLAVDSGQFRATFQPQSNAIASLGATTLNFVAKSGVVGGSWAVLGGSCGNLWMVLGRLVVVLGCPKGTVGFQRGAGGTKKGANWPTTRLRPRFATPFFVGGRGVSAQFSNLEKMIS